MMPAVRAGAGVRPQPSQHPGATPGADIMGRMTAPYTLILLRHGQSEWNKTNQFTGWVDVRLTEQGKAEAQASGTPVVAAAVGGL